MVKNWPANVGDTRLGFDPWIGKTPWRRKWQPTLVFLPGEFHGQRSLVGYSPWGHKESNRTEHTGWAIIPAHYYFTALVTGNASLPFPIPTCQNLSLPSKLYTNVTSFLTLAPNTQVRIKFSFYAGTAHLICIFLSVESNTMWGLNSKHNIWSKISNSKC